MIDFPTSLNINKEIQHTWTEKCTCTPSKSNFISQYKPALIQQTRSNHRYRGVQIRGIRRFETIENPTRAFIHKGNQCRRSWSNKKEEKEKKKKRKKKKVVERSSANVAAWNAYDNEPSRLPDRASEQGDDVEPIETSRPDTRKVEGEEADNRHRGSYATGYRFLAGPPPIWPSSLQTLERKSRSSTRTPAQKGTSHLRATWNCG